ncbi:uncharacterized protein KQ657_001780 [Scheffersomyces spartinae]|uniref:ER membrane protein complex subunit 4 n=1 Tax=Scheffersomyces spartinae TaxID=45513 RepID=A0A9P7V7L3_9ASCO|nr:uncharacterized protein KQ657_001780 [Scheffersomyces spartinae]KAG7192381.1 hypothetical protein KQ657_001780 [Scheffersomyces spartinae]
MYSELTTPNILKPSERTNPPGFEGSSIGETIKMISGDVNVDKNQVLELKKKKIWEIAYAPAKAIPMQLIMGYFMGNGLQIIPIMMTFNLLISPLKAIFMETGPAFAPFEDTPGLHVEVGTAKFMFIVCQLLNMSIGIYKLYGMGLIPHTESDWLDWKHIVAIKESIVVT